MHAPPTKNQSCRLAGQHERHCLDEHIHILVGVQPADIEDDWRAGIAPVAVWTEPDHVNAVGYDPDRHLEALAPHKVGCRVARARHGVELPIDADEILPELTAHPLADRGESAEDARGMWQ